MLAAEQTACWKERKGNVLSKDAFNPMNTAENNRLIAQMPNIRIFYSKKGRAKYISHLDITRCMQRSLKRAGLPVWYTQGFNPHMYMTFALPLPLGYDSECEAMDLRMTQKLDFEEIKNRLNQALPPDIRVIRAAEQIHKPQEIVRASYEVTFFCADSQTLSAAFEDFIKSDEILVMKRTKKGAKQVNLKPEFSIAGKELGAGFVRYQMLTTAGQKNFNPTLLTDFFLETSGFADVRTKVLRKQIFLEDGTEFC